MRYLIFFLLCTNVYAGFPYDKESKNITLLFTMTDENGRVRNLNWMESIFKDGKLGYEVRRHHNLSSPQIYEKITEAAKEVGKYGSLCLYFNSHGGGSGSGFRMTARGGSFKPSKALAAVAESRKVKRLLILIDTCHAAGGIQEGFQKEPKPIPKTGLPKLLTYAFYNPDAYEEVLVIASSSVEDLSIRGDFASRLKKAYESVDDSDESLTIAKFMRIFASLHSDTRQKPHYQILPNDKMLDEPLFYDALIRRIPIVDRNNPQGKYPPDYIPTPK